MAELPATASETFEIVQSVVSFDYFQPTEFIAVDFNETAPWSERFETLDYGSLNFVESMGSILIFCALQVLFTLITTFFLCFGGCNKCCCKRAK